MKQRILLQSLPSSLSAYSHPPLTLHPPTHPPTHPPAHSPTPRPSPLPAIAPVFSTVTITRGTLPMQRARLSVTPFDPTMDLLLVTDNNFDKAILPYFNKTTGALWLTHEGDVPVTNADWSIALRYMAWVFIADNGPPNACLSYTTYGLHREFALQAWDVQGRPTNVVTRRFNMATAMFIYTDEEPVLIDDSAGYKSVYISLPMTMNLFGVDTFYSNSTVIASPG